MQTLTSIPKAFTAGDTVALSLTDALYPPADGWALRVDLAGPGEVASWASTADGTRHVFALSSTDTENYAAGVYSYQLCAVAAGKRVTLERGQITVHPNLAGVNGAYDGRTWAAKALEAVEARLLDKATKDQLSYSIAGRSLARHSLQDLLALRDTLRLQVSRETGKARPRNIYVRFGDS